MRLIDADELDALFEAQVMRGPMDVFIAFDDALRNAQTIDAVPVVRCKDCKHLGHELTNGQHCCYAYNLPECGLEDFCSRGERRNHEDQRD